LSTDANDDFTHQDWDQILHRRGSVSGAAAAAASAAVTAVTAVPMSLPLVGPIVKRIRHTAPDQRVMIINESPEESVSGLSVCLAAP